MGNALGSQGGIPRDVKIESGVRVTHDLFRQIAGKKASRDPLSGPGRSSATSQGGLQPSGPGAATALPLPPRDFHGDLGELRTVGQLLLKQGKKEAAMIEEMAEKLLHSEYIAPSREPACREQANACLTCYQEYAQDAWKCRDAVDAYSACAKATYATFVK